jgi:hypothetical protein
MAKKIVVAAATAAAKPKAAPSKTASSSKKLSAPTALDVVDKSQAAKNPNKRSLKRSSSDAEVAKVIRDNFLSKGFNPAYVDEYEIDGSSLRDELKREMHAPVAKGMHYYQDKRHKYTPADAPTNQLKVINAAQILDPQLERTMALAMAHHPAYDPFRQYLMQAPKFNQRSYVFLLRGCLRVSPLRSEKACDALLAVLKYHERTKIHEEFVDEWKIVFGHFDLALKANLGLTKGTDVAGRRWWKNVRAYASLILPAVATDKCASLPVDGEWASVEAELREVVASSAVGKALFESVLRDHYSRAITENVKAIAAEISDQDITAASIEANTSKFLSYCVTIGKDAYDLEAPVLRDVTYRSEKYAVECTTLMDFFQHEQRGLINTVAVALGKMPPLWVENEIVAPIIPLSIAVDDCVLVDQINARETAESALEEKKSNSSSTIKEVLESHHSVFMNIDPFWKIMKAFFTANSGDVGTRRVRERILACLPVEGVAPPTIDEAMLALEEVPKSKLYGFVGLGAVSTYAAVHSQLQALMQGDSPNFVFDAAKVSLSSKVAAAFGLWCVFEEAGTSTVAGAQHRGKAASNLIFDKVSAAFTVDPKTAIPEFKELIKFAFLLPSDRGKQLDTWKDGLLSVATMSALAVANDNKKLSTLKVSKSSKNIKELLTAMAL